MIAPDRIDCGKWSKLDDMPVSLDTMASHMAALLEKLGLTRVDVVAHSMGNMAAVRFTRTFPDRVNKLVMYAPVGLERLSLLSRPAGAARAVDRAGGQLSGPAVPAATDHDLWADAAARTGAAFRRNRERAGKPRPNGRARCAASLKLLRDVGQPVVHELPLVDKPVLLMARHARSHRAGQAVRQAGGPRAHGTCRPRRAQESR